MIEDTGYGYRVDTAGLGGDEKMEFYKGPSSCGHISDGVGMNTGSGGFVISFADFEEVYLAEKAARADNHGLEPTPKQDANRV